MTFWSLVSKLSLFFVWRVEAYTLTSMAYYLSGEGRCMEMILSEWLVDRFVSLTEMVFLTMNSMSKRCLSYLSLPDQYKVQSVFLSFRQSGNWILLRVAISMFSFAHYQCGASLGSNFCLQYPAWYRWTGLSSSECSSLPR